MKLCNWSGHMGFMGVILFLLFNISIGANIFPAVKIAKAAVIAGKTHNMSLHPRYRLVGTVEPRSPRSQRFDCQNAVAVQRCYAPQQMRKAYDITRMQNAGYKGKGKTIVIIDAFQSPTIQHDLKSFDKLFGLNDPDFKIVAPDGRT